MNMTIQMSSIPEELSRKPAPEIGEHNLKILKEFLNYSEEKIENLKREGVI